LLDLVDREFGCTVVEMAADVVTPVLQEFVIGIEEAGCRISLLVSHE
jgi:hypothetical protein